MLFTVHSSVRAVISADGLAWRVSWRARRAYSVGILGAFCAQISLDDFLLLSIMFSTSGDDLAGARHSRKRRRIPANVVYAGAPDDSTL